MRSHRRGPRLAASFAAFWLMLLAGSAAQAAASAQVRLVQASDEAGSVRLEAVLGGNATPAGGPAAFGTATPYARVPSGQVELRLAGGRDRNVSIERALADGGRYTVVALPRNGGTSLRAFRDGGPRGGRARVRVIGAAPELGEPDVRLGGRTIAERVQFRGATSYASVTPGRYTLSVMRPRGEGAPIASRGGVVLSAGTSTTAVLAGSGGTEQRIIVASDGAVTPAAAPDTGLGGLSGEGGLRWALILVCAAAAGALGGGARLAAGRRTGGR